MDVDKGVCGRILLDRIDGVPWLSEAAVCALHLRGKRLR